MLLVGYIADQNRPLLVARSQISQRPDGILRFFGEHVILLVYKFSALNFFPYFYTGWKGKQDFHFHTVRIPVFPPFDTPFFIPIYPIMSLRLGDIAPNFQASTTAGEIDFYEYLGNGWGILFSHPADYTPVCTTELGRTAALQEEFRRRNTRVLAVSVDPLDKHFGWVNDINETQHVSVDFPIIADPDRKVSTLYDMIHPNASENFTVRSLFIIGPDKKVKLIITYPASTGRNFHEVLRVLDSLQLTANYSVATPADWQHGEDVIVVPAISTEDAIQKFPKGVNVIKPYLRYTPQPDIES